jgi:DNA-binding HxlR family transcriptional regulator/putative sterol carrier protein
MADMKSYGQYCPMSRTLGMLGERWSLLIVRDLLSGASRFNELARGLPGLSRPLLAKRLRQLEVAGVVERLGARYLLTEAGRGLEPVVEALSAWGAQWTFRDPEPDELDASVLVWWMHARLDTSDLPGQRHVFHIQFTDDPHQFWIVIESGDPSVCLTDPGFEVDVVITSDVGSLFQVWMGRLPLREAMRSGRIRFSGPAALTRRMPRVFQLSPLAPLVAANPSR